MDKLTLAHEMALAMQSREPIVDMKIVAALSFDYAEAMLAEEEKRKDKSLPVVFEKMDKVGNVDWVDGVDFKIDWDSAPSWAKFWVATSINGEISKGWFYENKPKIGESDDVSVYSGGGQCFLTESFGYMGNWKDSLRERP